MQRLRGRTTIDNLARPMLSESLQAPAAAATDTIVADVTIANGAQIVQAQPDVPRNLTATVTDGNASISAGTVTIVGTDPQGRAVTELLTLPTLTLTGTKIFAKVTTVTVAGLVGNAGGDNLKVGCGNVIGLMNDIANSSAIKVVYFNKAVVTPAAVATGTSKSGVNYNTGTYDASKPMHVLYQPGA